MLSDNIRNYRKKHNMSQDELADKLGVSRQSVSLWENGQTQPTIDNIIAMAKIFNISSDELLNSEINENSDYSQEENSKNKSLNKKAILTLGISASIVIIAVVVVILALTSKDNLLKTLISDNSSINTSSVQTDNTAIKSTISATKSTAKAPTATKSVKKTNSTKNNKVTNTNSTNNNNTTATSDNSEADSTVTTAAEFDLYSYCKEFAIKKGTINGDYTIYQQPSSKYGGYEDEYFSISYWTAYDKVEFCLHCPLDETLSHNFYITMRGGFDHEYEYSSSKYYRDNGESLRFATGTIDPSVFSDNYPISCDKYEGSTDGQNAFMEDTRVGICDLINCLKEFVDVENMDCDFSDFEFKNF